MEDTVFARIVKKELPAHIIYEDEETMAFLDHSPDAPGHTLIVPKEPSKNILDIEEGSAGALIRTAKKVATALVKAGLGTGVNLLMNNEHVAGQIVFYTHLHVIPRNGGDGLSYSEHGKPYTEGEAGAVAAKIRAHLGA